MHLESHQSKKWDSSVSLECYQCSYLGFWSWSLKTCYSCVCQHQDSPVKDLVTFYRTIVWRLKAPVHGIETHHARVENKYSLAERSVTSLCDLGAATWGCGNNLRPWGKNSVVSLSLFHTWFTLIACNSCWVTTMIHASMWVAYISFFFLRTLFLYEILLRTWFACCL